VTDSSRTFSALNVDQLERSEWLSLWWGFVWRGWVIGIATMLLSVPVGFVTGFMSGFALSLVGAPEAVPFVSFALGIVAGLVLSVVAFSWWLRWLLGARFGDIRLALFRNADG
jgi:hypothetical protein